jgi:5-hydroxyisourate hydrolase
MASLSTHVLDTSTGRPATGLRVTLESTDGSVLAEALTDDDGRVASLAGDLTAQDHVLRFDTGAWFASQDVTAFYPEVAVTFAVGDDEHYHVPLLLNPFGYATYRGS